MASSREELIDKILRQHLAPGEEEPIWATDVARYVTSPFALYCDMFAPEEERDDDSPLLEMLKERGLAHEQEVIEGETVPVPYQTLEDGFRLTLEMMAAGEPAIFQGPLVSKPLGMIGVPDQLRKVSGKSIFGNYAYRVAEVKLALNLTKGHIIQAAFYNLLLAHIQDSTPRQFVLINGRGEERVEIFDRWAKLLDIYMADVRDVVAGEFVPQPDYRATPAPWRSFGDKLAEGDLTRLWQIGPPRREALFKAGYYTIEDIARANESDLSVVRKLDSYVAGCIVPQAKAILGGVPVPKRPVQFPEAAVEMFLDMENMNEGIDALLGTRDGFVNYLIGVVVRSESEEHYIDFFAETPEEEEKCWQEFCELVASADRATIYYWAASAERVYIRKMMNKYKTSPAVRDKLNNSIDLQRATTDAFAFPTSNYGLKDIAGSLGFSWRLEGWDGLLAMIRYRAYLNSGSTNVKTRSEILTYNEDDCRAAMFVKDWLAANSP